MKSYKIKRKNQNITKKLINLKIIPSTFVEKNKKKIQKTYIQKS